MHDSQAPPREQQLVGGSDPMAQDSRRRQRARWNGDELGLAVARLVVALLVPAGEPVTVAIDDTLFRRRGKDR